MNPASSLCIGLFSTFCLGCIGCTNAPGHPAAGPEVPRPEQVMEFTTLYKQNCAGCHGENGKNGAATALANPVYLAIAGEATLRQITANGVAGKLMPAFETSTGGTLTDQQINSLIQGMLQAWGRPDALGAAPAPSYAASAKGNPADGQKAFVEFCAHCHGATGSGANGAAASHPNAATGSIVDPSY